jgi:transcriptional regulator with XRE-family HTH domain
VDFQELAQELSRLRKSKHISQHTMATHLHISRATISNFENGSSADIGLKKVMQMADYLGYVFSLREKSPFPTFEEVVNG